MQGVVRQGGWVSVTIAIGLAIVIATAQSASAQAQAETAYQDPGPEIVKYGRSEMYGGVDAARDQWLFYSGMTTALFSRDIYSDGWRLRFGGGYGRYRSDTVDPRPNCGLQWLGDSCGSQEPHHHHSEVSNSYAEALLGYYLQLGRLTAKAFAGASMSSRQHLSGSDSSQAGDGIEFGVKGALEFWLTINDASWTSLDLSYSTARDETSTRWRFGLRPTPTLSIGPELRYDKNIETGDGAWNGRAGFFVRQEWTGGEVSLAVGKAWWIDDWSAKDPSVYGTFNILFQY